MVGVVKEAIRLADLVAINQVGCYEVLAARSIVRRILPGERTDDRESARHTLISAKRCLQPLSSFVGAADDHAPGADRTSRCNRCERSFASSRASFSPRFERSMLRTW